MPSLAQISANQANAQHSTGPRTEAGKARSARNHFSHGLSSRQFVILPGQQGEFDIFMTELRDDIQPAGALEFDLFAQLAHASWTLRRCRAAEVQIQSSSDNPRLDSVASLCCADQLRAIDLHTRRAERSYQRALKELKALQTARQFNVDAEILPASAPRPLAVNHDLLKHHAQLARAESSRLKAKAIRLGSLEHSNPIRAV